MVTEAEKQEAHIKKLREVKEFAKEKRGVVFGQPIADILRDPQFWTNQIHLAEIIQELTDE